MDTLTPGNQFTSEACYVIMRRQIGIQCSLSSSESCSQVFTILLVWLLRVVDGIPREKWSDVVLAYDKHVPLGCYESCKESTSSTEAL